MLPPEPMWRLTERPTSCAACQNGSQKWVGDVGIVELLGERERDRLHAALVHPADLGGGELGVPQRHERDGDEASGVGIGPFFDLPIVVGADALHAEVDVRIDGVAERLPGDASDVTEEGVDVDAVLFHRLEALRGDVGLLGHVLPAVGAESVGELTGDGALHGAQAPLHRDVPDVPPLVAALDLPDVGGLAAPLALRHAVGPHRRRFLQVVVGRDDFVVHVPSPQPAPRGDLCVTRRAGFSKVARPPPPPPSLSLPQRGEV